MNGCNGTCGPVELRPLSRECKLGRVGGVSPIELGVELEDFGGAVIAENFDNLTDFAAIGVPLHLHDVLHRVRDLCGDVVPLAC